MAVDEDVFRDLRDWVCSHFMSAGGMGRAVENIIRPLGNRRRHAQIGNDFY